ncbi:MAG TPA: DUF935 domain-containing protein, partial [Chromatiales bacterium]|nr:DUF935 domain-containing protein [Chromatiales bacterium]
CHLFADIEEKDGHVFAEMGKRKRALLGLDWTIRPPRNASRAEQKAAALAEEIIGDLPNFEDLLLDLADAIGYAYSNLEMTWVREGKELRPERIDHRPPGWFTVAADDRDELRLRDGSAEGAPLRPFTWISHIHKATSGYLPRAGLHRVLAWPFLFKNYSVRDLAEFLEIYGLPMRLGTYPAGASDDEKATLLRAVSSIGHFAAGIIPEGMQIEFKDAVNGGADAFQAMIEWCERTQSKAILGGTLTSQADGASSTNALGNVHNEVRHDLLVSDAAQIAGTLTRDLVYPLVLFNSGGIDSLRRCPRFVFDTQQPEDLKLYAEALPALVQAGARIPVDFVNDKLRIPKPSDGQAVLGEPTATALGGHAHCPSCAALAAEPEPLDSLGDRLQTEADATLGAMLDRIRELVESSDSLESLRDRLLDVYGHLDIDDLSRVMAQGMATADLLGRFQVQQEQDDG